MAENVPPQRVSRVDETRPMINFHEMERIVDVMLTKFPLDSEEAREILGSYLNEGSLSNEAVLLIQFAIEEEPDVPKMDFNEIAEYDVEIVPYYIKKLGYTRESVMQIIRASKK